LITKLKNQNGVIALEASLVLTLFMFLILTLYSFFAIFEAQSKVGHALIESTQSLSLDPYATGALDWGEFPGSVSDVITHFFMKGSVENGKFVTTSKWYTDATTASDSESLNSVIKNRFVAYLANGEEADANALLLRLHVENGLKGVSFRESKIDNDGNISVVATYKVNYMFDYKLFGLKPMQFKQTTKSKLWLNE
jgi:hypothetical protein